MRRRTALAIDLTRRAAALHVLSLACLFLLIAILHTRTYNGRNYREDEINTVHAARMMNPAQIVQWMAGDVHPPGWRLFADFWVDAFGNSEAATRWSSQLINLLSFALVYQLGCHLRDRRTGFYAVALLGVYGFASNGMYEFRPYSALVALVCGLHLVYFRWLTGRRPRQMAVYVALGIAAMYTHFFAIFVFAAHALCLPLFHRYELKKYIDSALMWLAVGAAFSVWTLPLIGVMRGAFAGGYYNQPLDALLQTARFEPTAIGVFLLLLCPFSIRLARPIWTSDALRLPGQMPLLYPAALLSFTLGSALLVDQFYGVLNARGLQTIVMLVALLMALGLRTLPKEAALILLALLYLHAPGHIAAPTSNGPYREIAASMKPVYESDSLLVTDFKWAWRWLLPAAYYLMDFTPDEMDKARMFHLVEKPDKAHPPTYPDELVNVAREYDAESFAGRLPAHDQLWLLRQGGGNRLGAELEDWLRGNYALLRRQSWDDEYPTRYELSEYRRAPAGREAMLVAGDNMRLIHWTLLDSVQVSPCQTITLESWWQAESVDETPLTLTLILADSDGDGQMAISNSVPADRFTSDWLPGAFYRDRSRLSLPCDIADGSYPLLLGMKESTSGEILPLRFADGNPIGEQFYLTTLRVSPQE